MSGPSTYEPKSGITRWLDGWKLRNWRTAEGHDVKNRDQWEALDSKQNSVVLLRGADELDNTALLTNDHAAYLTNTVVTQQSANVSVVGVTHYGCVVQIQDRDRSPVAFSLCAEKAKDGWMMFCRPLPCAR